VAESERYKAGKALVEKLFGKPIRQGVVPDGFFKLTMENVFGDVWTRPGLELEERSIITITALTVLNREEELWVHLHGARNLGIPREKLEEIFTHLAHYGGWPVAVAALRKLEDVYNKKPREKAKV